MMLVAANATAQDHPFKAPLYWSVYENQIEKAIAGQQDVYISEDEWRANIDWVDANLKDLGFTMVCIDGWGDVTRLNENGYRASHSRHWEHDYAWWSAHLRKRGMTLGIYGNPLWVHVDDHDTETRIVGTDIPVSTLKDPNERAHFPWVQIDRPGAEAYIKGWVHYYADMGVRYYRIDFLSWYEDGWDRWMPEPTGPTRPREHYVTALRWMREAADERGMLLSLVMPHLRHEGEAELKYGHMIRINEDAGEGTWHKWSDLWRGQKREGWSVYANAADGLTYWSHATGRGRIILDPDFIRLNTFANDDEKRSVVSLCLVAGGALTIADQHDTIGNDLWLYANREMLALNHDGFVGKPLTHEPTDEASQIWTGQMSNGDWIIGLFNREDTPRQRGISFSLLGIDRPAEVRDLWAHENLGMMSSFEAEIPPRGCRILRVVPPGNGRTLPREPTALGVASLRTISVPRQPNHNGGAAEVTIRDTHGGPVSGATVRVFFSGSFHETVEGVTDARGRAVLHTRQAMPGRVRVNACVRHVRHPPLTYLGNLNVQTCMGEPRFVGGTFNGWSLQPMTHVDGWWRLNTVRIPSGPHRLKFANTADFSGQDWGDAQGYEGDLRTTTGGDPDVLFEVMRTQLFDILLDDDAWTYRIEPSDVKTLQEAMYVAGSFSDWKPVPMTFDGEHWVVRGIALDGGEHQMKFLNTPDWSGVDWGNRQGTRGIAEIASAGKPNILFRLPSDGRYRIGFNDISLEYYLAEDSP